MFGGNVKTVTAFEAKTHLSALLRDASRGETILITRHGEPVAQLGPPPHAANEARTAMELLFSQTIRLGVPIREAIEEGRSQ
jgi:prevent-host-death family protein